MTKLRKKLKTFFSQGDERSLAVKKNVVTSLFLKCVNILITLQIVPMTINYINPTKYGIWLTLSSIVVWMSYFDFGFAHGFRNRFTEARANGNILLAKEYVSTTYAIITILFSSILVLSLIANYFFLWSDFLRVDTFYEKELKVVFGILAVFFCINMVASVFTTMLTADQNTALSSIIVTGGQIASFITIFILTRLTEGSLVTLAFALSGIPCILLVLISFMMFHTKKYKEVAPSFQFIRFSLAKNIVGLGGQFFCVMLSVLFIFQIINIIISREIGAEAVTQYNICYKYFGVILMLFVIVLTPFWSAFADAFAKKDFFWMRVMLKKLELLSLLSMPVLLLMIFFSKYIFSLWIGDSVNIPFSLSACMAVFTFASIISNVYMYLINGTSKVRIQLLIYGVSALFAIPIMQGSCASFGIEGVLIFPTFVYVVQAIFGRLQILKIINGTATGLWFK